MKHCVINNIPQNPKELYDAALLKSYYNWVDEKGTKNNPSYSVRERSDKTYEEVFNIIKNNQPHWVISFRDGSLWNEEDYWEFGGCNIKDFEGGAYFIWILLKVDEAEEIFKQFNLEKYEY